MKLLYKMQLILCLGLFLLKPITSQAQYCTPTVTTGGLYLGYIAYDVANTGFTGGTHYNTTNAGYSQTIGSSSGTAYRYFSGGIYYGIINPTGGSLNYDFAVFVDWNNDGDFNDANESQNGLITGTVAAGTSSTTGTYISPPLLTPAGNYRVRIALSQNGPGTATACGSFTGEVEDYIVTVATNTAPVLKNTVTPILNSVFSNATNSNGFSINELVNSPQPTDTLIKDADDQGVNFNSKVPRGIAIYGQSATNGSWEYKVGAGSWTSIGAVSNTNALLLMADASLAAYIPGTRLRFVPTGAGTPSLSFKAWDGTTGNNGTYASAATTGGSSAFSVNNQTGSLSVVSNAGYTSNMYFLTANNNIYSAPFNRTAKTVANPETLLTGSTSYVGYDLDVEPVSNKMFWITTNQDEIMSSNADGSGVGSVLSGITYCTGIATGNGHLFYLGFNNDYTALSIFKVSITGTGSTSIYTSNTTTDSKDIEFYNNKLYLQYGDATGYHIASLDTTGANLTVLYTTPTLSTYFSGFSIANDTMYWSETGGVLKKKAISGGTVTTMVSNAARTISDLTVDGVNGTIYYTDNDINSDYTYTNIRKMATTGGTPTTVNTVTNTVYSLAMGAGSTPLPVTLLDFGGRYDIANASSVLEWKTATEQNNTHFTLERSLDAKSFVAVATVKGAGTSANVHSYSYNDHVADIASDVFYYRLQQVDNDNTISVSNIIKLTRAGSSNAVVLWPNPGKDIFNLHLAAAPEKPATLKVYSSDGRLVFSNTIATQNSSIQLSGVQPGVYMAVIAFSNGSQQHISIVKQ